MVGVPACCKRCNAAATRDYRRRNREKVEAYDREYKDANRDLLRARARARQAVRRSGNSEAVRRAKRAWSATDKGRASRQRWRANNPDRERAHSAKRRSTAKGRLENSFRSQINASIVKGSKAGRRTFAILGYTSDELKRHLGRQFVGRMSWKNYGEWHVDHILPLAMFHYCTPDDADFQAAWSLSNLRPLWSGQNFSKSAKRQHLL